MGLFSSLGTIGGNMLMPGIGGSIGGAIGGAMDGKGSTGRAQGMQNQVNQMSELDYQRSLPWDASGTFGSIKYDRDGKAVSSELSAPWQSQMDALLGRQTSTGEQIDKYSADPVAFGMQLAAQKRALREPDREQQRLSQESRLLGQGRLDTTGGAGQISNTEMNYLRQDQADEQASYLDALKTGTTLRNWQQTDRTGAMDIGKLPQQYQAMANSGQGGANPYANQQVQAAGNVYGAKGSQLDGIGDSLMGMFGGGGAGQSSMPTYGTSTTGANTGGFLYGSAPMSGFSLY